MADPNLVTTCCFHGREFLFKMNVLGNNLEILITDKSSGEEWQCSYNATYIESLTHKTGNFKQFDIFTTMLKSGLLRTSECVSLDLLTFEDLELLRSRKITKVCGQNNSNRRYLIVTYCVEFDRIRYPLPLEYCGLPDPTVLQATIKRLESELEQVKEGYYERKIANDNQTIHLLRKKIEELTNENFQLKEDITILERAMLKKPKTRVLCMEKAMNKLEKSVLDERHSHRNLVEKLHKDKMDLEKQLEKLKVSARGLKQKLKPTQSPSRFCRGDGVSPVRQKSNSSVNTVFRRKNTPFNKEPRIIIGTDFEAKTKASRSDTNWGSPAMRKNTRCSRRDTMAKTTNRSRSSSNSSFRYPVESPISRFHSPVAEKFESRSSSVASRRTSSGSNKRIGQSKHNEAYFENLENKIESLQRMLKRNTIK